jgi:hypothetical protein
MKSNKTANDYRATPWPVIEQPKSNVPTPHVPGEPPHEFPKAVKCHDGVSRIADDAEHEDLLLGRTEPVQTGKVE